MPVEMQTFISEILCRTLCSVPKTLTPSGPCAQNSLYFRPKALM